MLTFSGTQNLRLRLVLSTLTGLPVRVTGIRPDDENPGLKGTINEKPQVHLPSDYEIRFMKLLEKLTNGTHTEVGYTGTDFTFFPGTIYGGEITFDCGTDRSVVYFLEPLAILAPFSKFAFRVTLLGFTCDHQDGTIDTFKNVDLKILRKFGINEGLDLRIESRGAPPLGGGKVFFTCPVVQSLQTVQLVANENIAKIRGVASTTRVSPQHAPRMVEEARRTLGMFTSDVYIYTDVSKGTGGGLSPGFSISLFAETADQKSILSADGCGEAGQTPEELADITCRRLLLEIDRGGVTDQCHQWIIILMMSLGPNDLSKVVLGPLTSSTRLLLDDIKTFLGVSYKIRKGPPSTNLVALSCIGSGYTNLNRRTQ